VHPEIEDELAEACRLAHENAPDPAAARRAAELCELAERFDHAQAWWRYAAHIGDPDAIDYVEHVLRG
jgi:hypothetical protein